MRKIIPIDSEADFQIQDMFYSRTDSRGVIQDGNDIFVAISEFPYEDMIGKPHNIVRHPDMPRVVYQYFWEVLKLGQPVVAYVKNLTASGRYYWVLASVFPTEGGYISIRVKPTSHLLAKVGRLYTELLAFEKTSPKEDAQPLLLQKIQELGFESYRYFAIEALTSELNGRRQQMTERGLAQTNAFTPSLELCRDIYVRTIQVLKSKETLARNAVIVGDSYRFIKFVGINMMAEVERLGTNAVTLSIIAHTFETWAHEVYAASLKMSQGVKAMAELIDECSFIIASSRFQIEMSEFESERNLNRGALKTFMNFAGEALATVKDNIRTIVGKCQQAEGDLAALGEALSALRIVHQNGRIELAKLAIESSEFQGQLDNMKTFVDNVSVSSRHIKESLFELKDTLGSVATDSDVILREFGTILKEA